MRPKAFLVALLPVVLAASGCGFRAEPTGVLPAYPQRLVDGLGRTVEVDRRPLRVLSFDPGLSAAASAVGAGSTLLQRPPALAPADTNKIAALHPDLVLLPATTSPARADALSRRLAVPVYVAGFGTVAAVEHDIGQLGLATDHATAAGALTRRMSSRLLALRRAVHGRPPTPVFLDAGLLFPLPSSGLVGNMVQLAGGVDVAAGADPHQPFAAARLRAAAPQAFVAVAGRGTTLRSLRRSPQTRRLPAVRSGRFAALPAAALTDPGPGVIATLTALVRVLHPGAVPSG